MVQDRGQVPPRSNRSLIGLNTTFKLEVSEDGKTYREVAADSCGPAYTIAAFKPVTARYVRLVLGEVERTGAYGDAVWGAKDVYLFDAPDRRP